MKYVGEKQSNPWMCVFASVVGAVNSLVGKTVWTQQSLLDAWHGAGNKDPGLNFSNVMPAAIVPVQSTIKYSQYIDNAPPISDQEYLDKVRACIDRKGIVILSFEHANKITLQRLQGWHMISLVCRDGDEFEAWDTAGRPRKLKAHELVTHFDYGNTNLMVHDRHDMVLIERR